MTYHRFTDEWGHFTQMPELVIERSAELGTDAVFLFMYLRYRTNKVRGCAFPTYDRMIEDFGWGRRRIKAAMDILEEKKLLVKKKRFQQSTEYYLVRPLDVAVPDDASSTAEILPQEHTENDDADEPKSRAAELPVVPPTQQDLDSVTYTESKDSTDSRETQNAVRKRLELYFRSRTSLQPPKRKSEAGELWWSPLREIAELAGWDAARATAVIDECLNRARNTFQVSSPKSILKTARAVIAEQANGQGQSAAQDAKEFNQRTAAQRDKIRHQMADAQQRSKP
jgi:hypothetical protein